MVNFKFDELKKLLVSYDIVSTLLDYYGIDEDFKGYSESLNKNGFIATTRIMLVANARLASSNPEPTT